VKLLSLFAALLLSIAFISRAEDLKPSPADDAGFRPLFNGKDLTGWDGDPSFWKAEDGMIVGETTKENPIKHANTFLILREGDKDRTVGDFEFRVTWRFLADRPFGNSGIQYRSHRVHEAKNAENKWIVGGYQADCDQKNTYTGICYEERGRGIFCNYGKQMTVDASGKKTETGETASAEDLKKARKPAGEWNEYVVICKGHHCVQVLNGVVVADFTDEETGKCATSGILALQLHQGKAMRVEFKDPKIKTLAGGPSADARH
jgi:hypothetical protein